MAMTYTTPPTASKATSARFTLASLPKEQRVLIARKGGLTTAARHDGAANAARARRGLEARWEREADPDGTLSPQERARKIEVLRKLHYTNLSIARWAKKGSN